MKGQLTIEITQEGIKEKVRKLREQGVNISKLIGIAILNYKLQEDEVLKSDKL